MPQTNQDTFNEQYRVQIQEIHGLVDRARLLRSDQVNASNELLEKAVELAEQIQFKEGIGVILRELSVNYLQVRNFKSSAKSLEQAVRFFDMAGDKIMQRRCLNELSDIYFKVGDYELSLDTLLASLKLSVSIDDKQLVGEIYNKIGNIYKVIGEFQKAIEQHQKALVLFEQTGNQAQISFTNYNIGNCYNWAGELDVAFNYLDKSLKSAIQLRDPSLKTNPLGSLGILFTKNKNFARSEEYFYMAIESADLTGDEKIKADLLKSLGNLHIEQQQYDKAIAVLQEALQIADRLEFKSPRHLIHLFLSSAFEKRGDYKQALEHHKLFMEVTREISLEDIAIKTKGVQLKFDLEDIKKQKELAEHSARLKDRFLAGISHELRTPLNGVLGMANLLADTHPSPEQLEYINTIKLSANNLISIINDILDYSKIRSGEITFSEEEFSLLDVITSVSQTNRIKAVQKQLEFTLQVQPGVPTVITGDKARLTQILMNVISNAVKYTDKGSVTFDVNSKAAESGVATFIFTVTDTGIGIEEERIPYIFESFARQTAEESRHTEGTGLGLAIARQLVDLLKGKIAVISTKQKGSVFTIELPYKFSATAPASGKSSRNTALRNLSEISLLLVEDNKVNQFLGKQILTNLGFQVRIAGNGKEALEVLNKEQFDLILMDVNMPVMNGYDLTQVIRSQLASPKNEIPIVALTAYASASEKEKALALGMNDYVTKPYSPHELLHVIVRQLNLKQPEGKAGKEKAVSQKSASQANTGSQMISHLREIMNGNDQDMKKMLEMYLEQIPMINGLIKTAIANKNWEEVYQQAHKLKSSVKVLNITRMSELIVLIEEYARTKENIELVGALFEAFKKESKQVMKVMQDTLNKD